MKKIILVFAVLLFTLNCWSQTVSKTIHIDVPGSLSTNLTATEKATITDLTVTGNIDARDFKIMRDSLPFLIKLDLSGASIATYKGTNGTISSNDITYQANQIPIYAFWNSNKSNYQSSLITVILPLSISSIGDRSFYNCTSLTSITIPPLVSVIGLKALSSCKKLAEIKLASGNESFSLLDGVLFNKNKTQLIQYPIPKTDTAYTIPSSVSSIAGGAFLSCIGLTSINIPFLVTEIGYDAFTDCSGLRSITVNSLPLKTDLSIFSSVNKDSCILHVPYHTKALYASANYWRYFVNIVEATSGFLVDKNKVKIPAIAASSKVGISANVPWKVSSAQSWLMVTPGAGVGNDTLTISAQSNPSQISRWGTITVSAEGFPSQKILVLQAGLTKTLSVIPGTLADSLSVDELNGITDLTLIGSIDARDFKTMRDSMPLLARVDLSAVTVTAYEGKDGTYSNGVNVYNANEIPRKAFYISTNYNGNTDLISVKLPSSIQSIGGAAFDNCKELAAIDFPSSLTAIGTSAFFYCASLKEIIFPNSVTTIGDNSFGYCSGLSSIVIPNSISKINSSVFYYCTGLTSVSIPTSVNSIGSSAFSYCTSLTSITIPNSVSTIGSNAFSNCISLSSITIPNSVNAIGSSAFSSCISISNINLPNSISTIEYGTFYNCTALNGIFIPSSVTSIAGSAFYNCKGLTNITMNSAPIKIESLTFDGVNTSTCILNVPYKAKSLYSVANYWKNFSNIVEAVAGFVLDTNTLKIPSAGQSTTVGITANVAWTAASDQSWLAVTPLQGNGNTVLTLSSQSNPTEILRRATITVSAPGYVSQTIAVLQTGLMKCITITPGNLSSSLSTSQLKGITDLTISGSMDARDFKILRDSMPYLARLDLSAATIAPFTGMGGTGTNLAYYVYPANEVPISSFSSANSILLSIVMPESATSIGYSAFSSCSGLTSISIPASVNSIGRFAFSGCINLTSIYIHRATPVDLSSNISVFYNINKTNCTLYVPSGSKALYQAAVQWKDFTKIVELATALPVLSGTASIQVYPNPVVDNLHISGIDAGARIIIFDLNGRVVLEAKLNNSNTISLGMLPRGQYVLRAISSEKVENIKIIKL